MRCGHCQNYLAEPTSREYCLSCGSFICTSCVSGGTSHLELSSDDSRKLFEPNEQLCSVARRVGETDLRRHIKPDVKNDFEEQTQTDRKNILTAVDVLENTAVPFTFPEELNVYTERVSEKIYYIRDTIRAKVRQTTERTSSESRAGNSEESGSTVPPKQTGVSKEKQDTQTDNHFALNTDRADNKMPDESEFEEQLEPSAKMTRDGIIRTTEPLQVPLENLSQRTGRNIDMNLKLLNSVLKSRGSDLELCNEQESGYGSQTLLLSSNEMLLNDMKDSDASSIVTNGSNKTVESHKMNGKTEINVQVEVVTESMGTERKPSPVQIRDKSASIDDPTNSVVLRRTKRVSPERRFTRGHSRSSSLPDLLKSAPIERKSVLHNSDEKLSKSTVDLLEIESEGVVPFQMCHKDHKSTPTYICFKDNEIYCKVCVHIHNLHCKEKVRFIPEIPPETRTKACDDSMRDLLSVKERFVNVRDELNTDLQLLKDSRKEYIRSLMRFKQNMINLIDQIEKQALADMDLIYNLELDRFNKSLAKLESSMASLDQLLEEVKNKDLNEDNSIFYKIQSASKFVTECEVDLHGIHKSCFKTEFSFQPQESVTSLNNNRDSLWTIKLTKDVKCHTPYPCTCDRSFKYRKAELDKQFSAKLSGWSFDRDKCYISGCEFLDNGNLLLADNHNKKIKMFDKKYKFVSALGLSSLPWDLAVVDKNLAVVTIPDKKQLQFFETKPKLVSKHSVFLEKNCWGVAKANDLLVVTCWSRDTSEIVLTDTYGVGKRVIVTANRTPFNMPWYVSASNDVIRVSDWGFNKVTFLTLSGQILSQYSDSALMGTMGIFSDPEGNVYVCGRDTNNIHQVGSDGGKVQTILTERDGIEKPLCVCHCPLDNRLVVTSWMSDTVQVFRLV